MIVVLFCTIWNFSHRTHLFMGICFCKSICTFSEKTLASRSIFFVHVIAKNLRSWWCYGQGWASNVTVALCRKFLYSPMRQQTGIPRPKDSTVHCITLHSAQPNVLWNWHTYGVESVQDFLIKLDMKSCMTLVEISIFLLNHVIVRLTKIMNNLLEHIKIRTFKVIFLC